MSILQKMPHRCKIQRRKSTGGATDALGGRVFEPVVEQTDVPCWEQSLNSREVVMFDKRGVKASRKIYFTTDPAVTDRHEIVITHRMVAGVLTEIAAANQIVLQSVLPAAPDASAGTGRLFRVFCDHVPGAET